MNSFRRVIRKSAMPGLQKLFSFSVIISLIAQPMAAPVLLGAFIFSVPTKVLAQETEPVVEEVVVEEEEIAPEETPVEKESVPEEEIVPEEEVASTEEVAPVTPEEIPAVSIPTEELAAPASDEEEKKDEDKVATKDEKESLEGDVCLDASQSITRTTDADWKLSDDGKKAYTKENIALGVEYRFPGNTDVTVTFTCLPKDPAKRSQLTVEEIKASDIDLPAGVVAASEYAYDITTEMENGSFKYDLALPKNASGEFGISYIEKSAEAVVSEDLSRDDVKNIEGKKIGNKEETVEADALDHFTVFLVTANATIVSSSVGTPNNGWVSDNAYATFDNSGDTADYDFPDITVPAGSTILGVEVLVEAKTTGRDLTASLWNVSNSNPDAYTTSKTANLGNTDTVQTLGGSADLWGKTWVPSDFSSANFKVRIGATSGGGTASLDSVQVKVHYANPINWPTTWNTPNSCVTDPSGDESPSAADLIGTTGSPAVGFNSDSYYQYFREKVDGNPGTAGNLSQYAWVVLFQSTSPQFQYLGSLNGKDEKVQLWQNTSAAGAVDFNPLLNDPAETLLYEGSSSVFSRVTAVGSDYYVDWAIPVEELTSRGINPTTTKFFATSANENNFNKDHLKCYEAFADLSITKSDSPDPVVNGGVLTYTLAVHNDGPDTAKSVVVNDTLPAGYAVSSVVPSVGSCSDVSAPTVQCELGDMTSGANATVTVVGTITSASASVTNTATVKLDDTQSIDLNQANNSDTEDTALVQVGSITIVKDAEPNDTQDFGFTTTGTGLSNFSLDDDGEATLSNTKVFTNILAGVYSVTENATTGWTQTSATCSDGSPVSAINLSAGENVTCTFVNTLQKAHLTLVKQVTNNNGGNALATDWTLAANGPTALTGVTGSGAVTNVAVDHGTYTLSEADGPSGYVGGNWSCTNEVVVNENSQITLAPGQSTTCTITNDDQAGTLIIKKVLPNDNGGTATAEQFSFAMNGGGATAFEADGENVVTVDAGTYSVVETNPMTGYALTYDNCTDVVIPNGGTATCTITNDDIAPKLTVTKLVTNDDGGSLEASQVPLFVGKANVTSGVENVFEAGTYSVSETQQSGYSATIGGDCATDGSITLVPGDVKNCTITNDDIQPTLTVIKIMTNDNGGDLDSSDFTMQVTSTGTPLIEFPGTSIGNTVDINAGAYSVNEVATPGYTPNYSAECTGTIAPGQHKVCTITNDDQAPTLTLVKTVQNDNGGTKEVADFPLFISGIPVTSGQAVTLEANTSYTATETNTSGYGASSWGTDCTEDGTITLKPGENKVCTITNDDQVATLTVIKHVVNDNGGTLVAGDFTMNVTGTNVSSTAFAGNETGTVITLNAGAYSVDEVAIAGYAKTLGADCVGVIANGEQKTCTITNDDITPQLTVMKHVVNDNGGIKVAGDFTMNVTGTNVSSTAFAGNENGTVVTLNAGTYSVDETAASEYTKSLGADCSGTIALGERKTCTVTNDDKESVHVIATKIVCTNEADLPNYGANPGGPNITASSAADWVATHKSCSLAPDWQFQWSYDGTPHNGDNVALGGANWTTSDFTDGNGRVTMDVPNYDQSPKIWVREVYQDNFIPFTFNLPGGENNANPVSAEIYCHTDVVNYDNWDWVGNPQDGDTYYCVAWNAPKKGKIIIEKQTDPAGSERAFAFDSSWGESFELADDESVTYELMPGEYGVSEEQVADWELTEATCDDQSPVNAISLQSGETVTCVFKNQEKARIVATKIVCADEADLPNYGEVGGPNITPTTAVDWVATHESCRFQENWQFQWAYRSTNNPGDNTGASINPDWHTFGPTNVNGETSADVDLKSTSALWVREVWNEEYIPFTYGQDEGNPNSNDQSAEIYCHTDVVNYDNYDLIDTSDTQLTYNCVAWNVEQKGTIIGEKYEDINGNGVRDEEDGALAGWTLYVDLNQNGILDENEPFGVTNEQGQYVFVDLPAGESYVVEEVQQSGWEQTANTCKGDREEENNQEEAFPVLNDIQEIIFGLDERTEPLGGGQTVRCALLNHFTDPELTIEKTNDSFPTVEAPGNTVTFTLKVKASKNKVENVTVTDLPPAGFAYVSGSATVTSTNGAHSGPLELTHVYASPGVWSLGTLEDGEEATLTYQAKISGSQDEGTYNDLAYAAGASLRGADVLATDVSDADNFAATRVAVALTEQNKVKIDEDEEEETDTKKKYVLGAALPATGATTSLLVLALALLLAGGAILLGNRKKTLVKVLVLGLLMTGGLLGGVAHAAPAPEGLAVTMEDPDAAVTTNSFKIGFVALDILNRTVEVACFSNGVQYDSYTLIPGGSSGDCQVNSTAMPVAGTYDFYVTATVDGESGGTLESNHETVNLVTGAPGKPREYDRDESTCDDKISFRTDSDGGRTVKVEVYRSKNKSFVATTPVATLAIGSDTEGTITTTPPSCHEDYWYAIRAVDADGIGSEFVGDVDVNVTTDTKTETITRPGEQAASGALPVTAGAGATTEGGAVEGAATGENANENGAEVLGEMTEDDQSGENSWMKDNKGGLFIGALLILGALYYLYARRRMATASLTDNE